ncbi:hypothetical protein CALCODRAFT_500368 [Calocera cornea HHB12733]|uniref:Uncharacterized protein n=1 Tax=Calocera cornea HHB12733 TaxID=1353952 RepID=A0A165E3R6_9BASI|nr:hypothetical protein CALCODRAFT_500368 [Calocera cornea HHB12733]
MSVSNNPFAPPGTQYVHPDVQAAAYQYPDISGGSYSQPAYQQQQYSGQQQQQQPQYLSQSTGTSGIYGQQQPQYTQQVQQPQQTQQWSYASGSALTGMPTGQSLSAQGSGLYGQQQYAVQPQPQPQVQSYGGVDMSGMGMQQYGGYQNGGYGYAGTGAGASHAAPNPAVAAFDPLSQQQQQQQQHQQQQQPSGYHQSQPQLQQQQRQEPVKMQPGLTPTISNYGAPDSKYNEHPRQLVLRTKQQLESFDKSAWKNLVECVEALREAWQARKAYLDQLPKQWPGIHIDVPAKMKEATEHIDGITAVRWQLAEIQNSYQLSHDTVSRNRVREQLNAGFKSLPDWPERTDELRNSLPELLAQQRIPPNALSPPPPSPLGSLPPQQYGQQQYQPQQQQYQPQPQPQQQYGVMQMPVQQQQQQPQGQQATMWTPQGQLTLQQYQQLNMQQQQQQQQQMMGQYGVQAAPQYGWR